MPLSIVPAGSFVKVKRVAAEDKVKKHLRELGISDGATLKVLASDGGNVILLVKEGRLCLDRGLASKIIVAVA